MKFNLDVNQSRFELPLCILIIKKRLRKEKGKVKRIKINIRYSKLSTYEVNASIEIWSPTSTFQLLLAFYPNRRHNRSKDIPTISHFSSWDTNFYPLPLSCQILENWLENSSGIGDGNIITRITTRIPFIFSRVRGHKSFYTDGSASCMLFAIHVCAKTIA